MPGRMALEVGAPGTKCDDDILSAAVWAFECASDQVQLSITVDVREYKRVKFCGSLSGQIQIRIKNSNISTPRFGRPLKRDDVATLRCLRYGQGAQRREPGCRR